MVNGMEISYFVIASHRVDGMERCGMMSLEVEVEVEKCRQGGCMRSRREGKRVSKSLRKKKRERDGSESVKKELREREREREREKEAGLLLSS